MIVWSKGLGKQSLLIELDKAELRVEKDYIGVDGIIESLWWQYTLKLTAQDLVDFLSILSSTKTSSFVAKERGIFWRLMRELGRFIPQVLWGIIRTRVTNLFTEQR